MLYYILGFTCSNPWFDSTRISNSFPFNHSIRIMRIASVRIQESDEKRWNKRESSPCGRDDLNWRIGLNRRIRLKRPTKLNRRVFEKESSIYYKRTWYNMIAWTNKYVHIYIYIYIYMYIYIYTCYTILWGLHLQICDSIQLAYPILFHSIIRSRSCASHVCGSKKVMKKCGRSESRRHVDEMTWIVELGWIVALDWIVQLNWVVEYLRKKIIYIMREYDTIW